MLREAPLHTCTLNGAAAADAVGDWGSGRQAGRHTDLQEGRQTPHHAVLCCAVLCCAVLCCRSHLSCMKAVVMTVHYRPQRTHPPQHTLLHHALVTAHLSGLHGAIKMLVAKLAVLQTHLRDVASGALKHMLGMKAQVQVFGLGFRDDSLLLYVLKHMLGMKAQDDGLLLYTTHRL